MNYRCKKCDTLNDINVIACKGCKSRNPLQPPARPVRPVSKPKERIRSARHRAAKAANPPADPAKTLMPMRVQGRLEESIGGPHLVTPDGRWKVHVLSNVPATLLYGVELEWERESVEGKVTLIRPVHSRTLSELAERAAEIHHRFLIQKVGIRPVGSTTVEAQVGLAAQAREIERLAKQPFPTAWADMCSCWRLPALRGPLQAAMNTIGWPKIQWLVTVTEGWPTDLVALVQGECKKLFERVGVTMPWSPDDYLLQDD